MRIGFHGRLEDRPEIRAGFIGCGSHAFRNIYPTFQFAPVRLAATCDLDGERARAFAERFGAESSYTDYHEMLEKEDLDAVFVVTGYGPDGRPLYPAIASECLRAGVHVWIEKPPAASCEEISTLQSLSRETGKTVMVGFKKMFFPANEKARELMHLEDFGGATLVSVQYPQGIPPAGELRRYVQGGPAEGGVVGFLDHLCHPVSLIVFLLGMPATLFYQRSEAGSGAAVFTFETGEVAVLSLTAGQSLSGGMERTLIVGRGRHIVVENNIRVSYHRNPPVGYGDNPDFFRGTPEETTAVWEPEFSLGQLYNKGLFLLGYYGEVREFAESILEGRPPAKGTLEQAWQVTRVFEAFAEGPGQVIPLT